MGLSLLLNEQAKGTEWRAQRYWMSSAVKIFRLPFEGLLPRISLLVILEPSCKVIKEMLFRIVLSSVDHLPSRSAYIFLWKSLNVCSFSAMYSHPVSTMHLDISPSGLLILFLPAHILCFCPLYTPFLSALTLFLSSHLLGFPTLQPISLYGNAPFVLHLEKYHPSFALPLSPHPFRSPFPVSRCAPFFSCPAIPIPLCPSIQLPPLFSLATPRH